MCVCSLSSTFPALHVLQVPALKIKDQFFDTAQTLDFQVCCSITVGQCRPARLGRRKSAAAVERQHCRSPPLSNPRFIISGKFEIFHNHTELFCKTIGILPKVIKSEHVRVIEGETKRLSVTHQCYCGSSTVHNMQSIALKNDTKLQKEPKREWSLPIELLPPPFFHA